MTTRQRRILATVILTITLGVTVGGTAQARSTSPSPQPGNVSTSIPDTPVGRQLGWLLEAKSLPVPVPVLEEHFSAAFLAQVPPDQLNGLLGALSGPCQMLEVVAPNRSDRATAKRRIAEAAEQVPAAAAVRHVIEAMNAAVIAGGAVAASSPDDLRLERDERRALAERDLGLVVFDPAHH